MKLLKYTYAVLLVGTLSFSSIQAQDAEKPGKREGRGGPMSTLQEDERQKLWSALRDVKDEPSVSASREAVRKAMDEHKKILRDAVVKKDPSLAPTVEKLGEAFPPRQRGDARGGRPGAGQRGGDKESSDKPDDKRKEAAEELMDAAGE